MSSSLTYKQSLYLFKSAINKVHLNTHGVLNFVYLIAVIFDPISFATIKQITGINLMHRIRRIWYSVLPLWAMGTAPHSCMMIVEAQTTVTSVKYVSNGVYRVHMCKLIAK